MNFVRDMFETLLKNYSIYANNVSKTLLIGNFIINFIVFDWAICIYFMNN